MTAELVTLPVPEDSLQGMSVLRASSEQAGTRSSPTSLQGWWPPRGRMALTFPFGCVNPTAAPSRPQNLSLLLHRVR